MGNLKAFLSKPVVKIGEHLSLSFLGAFGLCAIATLEHAASTKGFQLSWSLIAGVVSTAATAGYHTIRPQLVKLFLRLLKKQ